MRVKTNMKIDEALVKAAIKKGSARGLFAAMDELGRVSKRQVPLDEGTLRASGTASVSDDGKTGCYSYDTKYAVVQHEHTEYQHQRGRKAKYLEDPINDPKVQHDMLTILSESYTEMKG